MATCIELLRHGYMLAASIHGQVPEGYIQATTVSLSIANDVYKILPEAPLSPLPKALPLSVLDAKDGFIHLSTAEKTPATASRFYSTANALWLLRIPMDRIQGSVKWDDANSGCFAHLYEKDLGIGEVVETKQIPEGCTGQLDERAGARWLAYLNLDLTSCTSGDQTRQSVLES